MRRSWRALPSQPTALAGLLLVMGTLHFAMPAPFERLVPRFLGPSRAWVWATGAAELLSGVALLVPATRRAGALGAATTLVVVFPGNVTMAIAAGAPTTPSAAALWLRLPIQVPLVLWALHYARPAAPWKRRGSAKGEPRLPR